MSMATTGFCSDMPAHLVYGTIICFPTGQLYQTHLQVMLELFVQEEDQWNAESDDLASIIPDLNLTEMVWDDLDRRGKEKQPTNSPQPWELLPFWKTIPGDDLMRLTGSMQYVRKVVVKAKGGNFNIFLLMTKLYLFGHYFNVIDIII